MTSTDAEMRAWIERVADLGDELTDLTGELDPELEVQQEGMLANLTVEIARDARDWLTTGWATADLPASPPARAIRVLIKQIIDALLDAHESEFLSSPAFAGLTELGAEAMRHGWVGGGKGGSSTPSKGT